MRRADLDPEGGRRCRRRRVGLLGRLRGVGHLRGIVPYVRSHEDPILNAAECGRPADGPSRSVGSGCGDAGPSRLRAPRRQAAGVLRRGHSTFDARRLALAVGRDPRSRRDGRAGRRRRRKRDDRTERREGHGWSRCVEAARHRARRGERRLRRDPLRDRRRDRGRATTRWRLSRRRADRRAVRHAIDSMVTAPSPAAVAARHARIRCGAAISGMTVAGEDVPAVAGTAALVTDPATMSNILAPGRFRVSDANASTNGERTSSDARTMIVESVVCEPNSTESLARASIDRIDA